MLRQLLVMRETKRVRRNIQCEEDEGLVCFLPAAVHVRRSVQVTVVPVVVLCGEDECREPAFETLVSMYVVKDE